MDRSTLQLFTDQLATWAKAAIEHGRSPFRKVEAFPALVTESGELHPPLVFWINRDSCMAGGVVVFPAHSEGNELEEGRACAAALGLRHLVSWEARRIVFWELREGALSRHKAIDLCESGHPARFREALGTVMEELKVLSVVGAVPPEQLSAHYLANLCLGTRLAALPSLTEGFRLARGEALLDPDASPADLAERKAAMTLLRLLGLVLHDRLPSAVQPEGLERAMLFALEALPDPCRKALQMAQDEMPLPAESAVVFHHLFRRLIQLRLQRDRARCTNLLEILHALDSRTFGGHPLPGEDPGRGEVELLLYPDHLPLGENLMVCASGPLMAAAVLARSLSGEPPFRLQTSDLFVLTPEVALKKVRGTLCDMHVPTGPRRKNLSARLRLSWPARRFPLPARTPIWLWELLHLLGIAAAGCRLDIVVPKSWLTEEYGIPLMDLFREHFLLDRLVLSEGRLHMTLRKTGESDGVTVLEGPQGQRSLPWGDAGHQALLSLSLHLPDDLFALLEGEVLQVPDEPGAVDPAGLALFCRSSLGRTLWSLVSANRTLPPPEKLEQEVLRRGMPLPTQEVLAGLTRLAPASRPPTRDQLDQELKLWLGAGFSPLSASVATAPPREESGAPRSSSSRKGPSVEKISAEVFVDGLPLFPEQYLYDHYRPQLEEYRFVGPLAVGDEFFGRHRLRDREGATLEVEGEETARALVMASFSGRQPVSLPADRKLTATILECYLADLARLKRKLLRETHLHAAGGRAAENLARKIWHSHPLPPWELVEIKEVL